MSGVVNFRQEWSTPFRSGQLLSAVVNSCQELSAPVRNSRFSSGVVVRSDRLSIGVVSFRQELVECGRELSASVKNGQLPLGMNNSKVVSSIESDKLPSGMVSSCRGCGGRANSLLFKIKDKTREYDKNRSSHGGSVHREWACDHASRPRLAESDCRMTRQEHW